MKPKGVVGASSPKWISVKDRLPEIGVDVLVYSEMDGVCVDYFGGENFGWPDVTHWMPLPELPKEVKDA